MTYWNQYANQNEFYDYDNNLQTTGNNIPFNITIASLCLTNNGNLYVMGRDNLIWKYDEGC